SAVAHQPLEGAQDRTAAEGWVIAHNIRRREWDWRVRDKVEARDQAVEAQRSWSVAEGVDEPLRQQDVGSGLEQWNGRRHGMLLWVRRQHEAEPAHMGVACCSR